MATIVVFGLVHQGKEEALQEEEEEEALQAPGSPLSVHAAYLSILLYLFQVNRFNTVFLSIVVTAE